MPEVRPQANRLTGFNPLGGISSKISSAAHYASTSLSHLLRSKQQDTSGQNTIKTESDNLSYTVNPLTTIASKDENSRRKTFPERLDEKSIDHIRESVNETIEELRKSISKQEKELYKSMNTEAIDLFNEAYNTAAGGILTTGSTSTQVGVSSTTAVVSGLRAIKLAADLHNLKEELSSLKKSSQEDTTAIKFKNQEVEDKKAELATASIEASSGIASAGLVAKGGTAAVAGGIIGPATFILLGLKNIEESHNQYINCCNMLTRLNEDTILDEEFKLPIKDSIEKGIRDAKLKFVVNTSAIIATGSTFIPGIGSSGALGLGLTSGVLMLVGEGVSYTRNESVKSKATELDYKLNEWKDSFRAEDKVLERLLNQELEKGSEEEKFKEYLLGLSPPISRSFQSNEIKIEYKMTTNINNFSLDEREKIIRQISNTFQSNATHKSFEDIIVDVTLNFQKRLEYEEKSQSAKGDITLFNETTDLDHLQKENPTWIEKTHHAELSILEKMNKKAEFLIKCKQEKERYEETKKQLISKDKDSMVKGLITTYKSLKIKNQEKADELATSLSNITKMEATDIKTILLLKTEELKKGKINETTLLKTFKESLEGKYTDIKQ